MQRSSLVGAMFIVFIALLAGGAVTYWQSRNEPLAAVPSSSASDNSINWLTSTSSGAHPFSFDYPEDWRVKETSTITRATYSSDVFIDIAYITPSDFIDELHTGEGSFTELTNSETKRADEAERKLYIVNTDTGEVDGHKTRVLEYCMLPQQDGLMTETCLLSSDVVYGEDTYNLTLTIRNASLATQKLQRESYRAIFNRMLGSLKPIVPNQ